MMLMVLPLAPVVIITVAGYWLGTICGGRPHARMRLLASSVQTVGLTAASKLPLLLWTARALAPMSARR